MQFINNLHAEVSACNSLCAELKPTNIFIRQCGVWLDRLTDESEELKLFRWMKNYGIKTHDVQIVTIPRGKVLKWRNSFQGNFFFLLVKYAWGFLRFSLSLCVWVCVCVCAHPYRWAAPVYRSRKAALRSTAYQWEYRHCRWVDAPRRQPIRARQQQNGRTTLLSASLMPTKVCCCRHRDVWVCACVYKEVPRALRCQAWWVKINQTLVQQ